MTASPVIASRPYPFSLTVVGAIDSEITWLTDSNLGTIINGETSLLRVEAVNRGGRELEYRLASGEFNSLPQGLELLPSGDIAGRVTFNTFAIDLGDTTFDSNQTIWDSEFDFVVNAYAPDTQQTLYSVSEITILTGGTVCMAGTNADPASNNATGFAVQTDGLLSVSRANSATAFFNRSGSDGEVVRFYRGGAQVGNINVSSVATTYNSISDYRLKEDLKPI
jgi:hypothetical protein